MHVIACEPPYMHGMRAHMHESAQRRPPHVMPLSSVPCSRPSGPSGSGRVKASPPMSTGSSSSYALPVISHTSCLDPGSANKVGLSLDQAQRAAAAGRGPRTSWSWRAPPAAAAAAGAPANHKWPPPAPQDTAAEKRRIVPSRWFRSSSLSGSGYARALQSAHVADRKIGNWRGEGRGLKLAARVLVKRSPYEQSLCHQWMYVCTRCTYVRLVGTALGLPRRAGRQEKGLMLHAMHACLPRQLLCKVPSCITMYVCMMAASAMLSMRQRSSACSASCCSTPHHLPAAGG